MFLIAYSVVMRYFLNQPVAWVDELVGYLLVASVMLAAADALLEGEHIAVDIVTERLGARGRRAGHARRARRRRARCGAAAPSRAADMVAFSRMVGLMSNGYLAVPMWIPQLLVPVGAALLLAPAAVVAFVAALAARSGPPRAGAAIARRASSRPGCCSR